MSVDVLSRKIDIFLAMIQAGNGWYAMAVGLGVVFTSLILVSIVISITGVFFRRRMARMLPAPPAGEVTSDEGASAGEGETEIEMVAAAVAVALAMHRPGKSRRRGPGRGPSDDREPWRLTGRAIQHSRSGGSR